MATEWEVSSEPEGRSKSQSAFATRTDNGHPIVAKLDKIGTSSYWIVLSIGYANGGKSGLSRALKRFVPQINRGKGLKYPYFCGLDAAFGGGRRLGGIFPRRSRRALRLTRIVQAVHKKSALGSPTIYLDARLVRRSFRGTLDTSEADK